MTFPPDYTQQLLAYLQAWRQYLEQATGAAERVQPFAATLPSAMTATPPAAPFMPPVAPPMPPVAPPAPPTPPAPTSAPGAISATGYTQQLLASLQAWRQYLEHATGAAPGSSEPTTTRPTPPPRTRPAQEHVPPDHCGSGVVPLPSADSGSGDDDSGDFRGADTARPQFGSAYSRATDPAGSGASGQATPRSLYSGPAAPTESATWPETGQGRARRAAPEHASDEIELVPPSSHSGFRSLDSPSS